MWLSGPTGNVRSISITARKISHASALVCIALVLLGFVLNWVGLRFAVEYSPELARSIGGVTTEAQHQRMESDYRARLDAMREKLQSTVQEIQRLESLKSRLMDIATPNMLREKVQSTELGKGGPLLAPKLSLPFFRAPLNQAIGQTASDIEQLEGAVNKINQTWKSQIEWLESIPNGLPISGNFHFTSGFGIRNDPFTGSLAMHEGIDFSADPGTSVLAAAAGKVVRSAFDPNFGNVVEIQHAEGFLTRYAHLRTRQVAVNAVVARGTQLGEVGNTGRSTGAHLHFEIFRDERVMNPMQVLTYRNH